MTSSEAHISSMALEGKETSVTALIPLDHTKIVALFNAPRPDKNYSDHAGPAALRVVFVCGGQRKEVVLPVMLQPQFVNNTQWIQLVGSKVLTLERVR